MLTALSLLFAFAIGGDPAAIARSPLLSILADALSAAFTISGAMSFFVGVYAVIRHKDLSVGKALAVLYALTITMFLIGEFLFPH